MAEDTVMASADGADAPLTEPAQEQTATSAKQDSTTSEQNAEAISHLPDGSGASQVQGEHAEPTSTAAVNTIPTQPAEAATVAVQSSASAGQHGESSSITPVEDKGPRVQGEEVAPMSVEVPETAPAHSTQDQTAIVAAQDAARTTLASTDTAPAPPPQEAAALVSEQSAATTSTEGPAATSAQELEASKPVDVMTGATTAQPPQKSGKVAQNAAPTGTEGMDTNPVESTQEQTTTIPEQDTAPAALTQDAAVPASIDVADIKAAERTPEQAIPSSTEGLDVVSSQPAPGQSETITTAKQEATLVINDAAAATPAPSVQELGANTTTNDIDVASARPREEQAAIVSSQDVAPTSAEDAGVASTPPAREQAAATVAQDSASSSQNAKASSHQATGGEGSRARREEALVSAEARVRREEAAATSTTSRARRENEDLRLMWLSLPSHDHPTYYSDTDAEASSSSSVADAIEPRSVAGRTPYLSGRLGHAGVGNLSGRRKDREDEWRFDGDDDRDSSDDDAAEAELYRHAVEHEKMYRIGNRGNKLRKNARWVRNGKLGTASEARNEKDIHERFTARLKALQRSQVESLLHVVEGPQLAVNKPDILDGSDRLLLRDAHLPLPVEESSTLLAPQLLRPILSARALLQSHTLRHTFRNPHIGALSRTALDLRESESHLSRALAQCLGAMEKAAATAVAAPAEDFNGTKSIETLPRAQPNDQATNGRTDKNIAIDPQSIGMEGTHGTSDELNPAFSQLDRLFVTKEGLPIPLGGGGSSEDGQMLDEQQTSEGGGPAQPQTILSAAQQRDVVRAALECLHELGADSLEYVERLDEARTRLAAVKQKRMQVWNALRRWALKREGEDPDSELGSGSGGGVGTQKGGADVTSASAAAAAATAAEVTTGGGRAGGGHSRPSGGGRSGKRQRV